MDVRDSPRRPPRERLSEGSGRGKSSGEIGREAGPGARPPRASRPFSGGSLLWSCGAGTQARSRL